MAKPFTLLLLFGILGLAMAATRFETNHISHFEPLSASRVSMLPMQRQRDTTADEFELSIEAFGKQFTFQLELNTDLFSPDAKIIIVGEDGKVIDSYYPTIVSYRSVNSDDDVSVTVLDATKGILKGMFSYDGETYYIDPSAEHLPQMSKSSRNAFDSEETASEMIIYKASALQEDPENPVLCGVKNPETGEVLTSPILPSNSSAGKRSVSPALKLPAYNCPTTPKQLIIGIAADSTYISTVNRLGQDVATYIQAQFNTISQIYSTTANVRFQIGQTQLFPTAGTPSWNSCPSIDSKLNSFSSWRGQQPSTEGLWHLMTGCYPSGTVGMAWINVLCQTRSYGSGQSVSGTGVSSHLSGAGAYRVPAHEIGHNFGCQHTSDGIMIASNIREDVFHSSSQQTMCNTIANSGSCLQNAGTCTPNCSGKNCGSNGCGGTCGTCSSGSTCSASGVCQTTCTPNCNGKNCGSDGCGGSCGSCSTGSTCSAGVCTTNTCTPNCSGRNCGSNGCGGSCGTCASGSTCSAGICTNTTCTPNCSGKDCGSNGCGGSCGTCATGTTCTSYGVCLANTPTSQSWTNFVGSMYGWRQATTSPYPWQNSDASGSKGLMLVNSAASVKSSGTTWQAQVALTSTTGHVGVAFAIRNSNTAGVRYIAVTISSGSVYVWKWYGNTRYMYRLPSSTRFALNTYYTITVRVTQSSVIGVTVGGRNLGYYNLNEDLSGGVGLFSRTARGKFKNSVLRVGTSSLSLEDQDPTTETEIVSLEDIQPEIDEEEVAAPQQNEKKVSTKVIVGASVGASVAGVALLAAATVLAVKKFRPSKKEQVESSNSASSS